MAKCQGRGAEEGEAKEGAPSKKHFSNEFIRKES